MRVNSFDLSGKRALVTGSGQGIGLALAQALSSAGAELILNGRNINKLQQAEALIGSACFLLVFDVTDHTVTRKAIDDFEQDHGSIDILVNNAGIQYRAPLEEFPEAEFERLLHSNISSVFHVSQAVARHMIRRKCGKIINIASIQTHLARSNIGPYTATKGAVGNLTKAMAADWGPYGLNCNAIAPGYFKTPLNQALIDDPSFCEWLEKRTPMRRWGNLEELAGACIFLASQASSFVNGHILYVDGGITATV